MNIKLVPGKNLAKNKESLLKDFMNVHNYLEPHLAIILVGDNQASLLYVRKKKELAESLGIRVTIFEYEKSSGHLLVTNKIIELNKDKSVTGIMIQAPVGDFTMTQTQELFNTIDPQKDVDGLGAVNLGYLWQNKYFAELDSPVLLATQTENINLELKKLDALIAATPLAILDCLSWVYNASNLTDLGDNISGKKILIANRSSIVGKPLSGILLGLGSSVELVHSQTPANKDTIKDYDIVITAIGKSNYWHSDDFRAGQVVIDAAITKNDKGGIAGDVTIDYSNVDSSNINPGTTGTNKDLSLAGVPGGVGPLTITNLLMNTIAVAYFNYKNRNL